MRATRSVGRSRRSLLLRNPGQERVLLKAAPERLEREHVGGLDVREVDVRAELLEEEQLLRPFERFPDQLLMATGESDQLVDEVLANRLANRADLTALDDNHLRAGAEFLPEHLS